MRRVSKQAHSICLINGRWNGSIAIPHGSYALYDVWVGLRPTRLEMLRAALSLRDPIPRGCFATVVFNFDARDAIEEE